MKKLSRKEWIGVGVALVITFGMLFFSSYVFKPTENPAQAVNQGGATTEATQPVKNVLPDGLTIQDFSLGEGREVKAGDSISVNYTGMLNDGTKFDSSYDRGEPIVFTVGTGQLIKGFDEGTVGMKIGGKRRLIIPPDLGYGAKVVGPIPANSTLVFDVELVSFK